LIDTHCERVAAPLRARVAALAGARVRHEAEWAWGVLPPSRRAQVQRRVLSEVVRPLALALVGSRPIMPDTHV
jgi:hypothetical protein